MSKIMNRDASSLARVVPHLPPETLHQLIRSRGLDACTELVTSATPAQLRSLLDLDLWRHARPGRHEQFDVDRFAEWLEVLVDAGSSVAARTVAALDKDLVILGLSRYLRVFDPGIFEPTAQSDDEPTDRHEAMREGDAPDSSGDRLECEIAGYIVRARRADAWDAIVTLLVTLGAEHGGYFDDVMQGCRRLSNSTPEIDGLDDLLLAPEQHLHDVAIERERRRSQRGYATPGDARAFLEIARRPKPPHAGASRTETIKDNPIVTAYFRAADEALESSDEPPRLPQRRVHENPTGVHESLDADVALGASLRSALELLDEAGVMPERPRGLLEAADADPQAARLTRLRRLMAHVRDSDETAYLTRSRELAFLANTLLAGCSVQSRPFTPREASDAAAAICNLGLEHWPGTCPADAWLIDHDLVSAFEAGWSVLHQDVSLFAAEQLISILDDLRPVDRDIRFGLVALRRSLVKQRAAGTPWRARGAADILATLDMTAWVGVVGLLDECPIVPAALTAVLDRRTTAISPTAFDFISTAAQISDIHAFVRKLPDILSD